MPGYREDDRGDDDPEPYEMDVQPPRDGRDVLHTSDRRDRAGLDELDGYLTRLGLNSGIVIIFDRRREARQEPPDT